MRTFTRDEVEQVVESVVREAVRDATAPGPDVSDVDEAEANGRMDGAREVLRRLDALPNPPATPESSTLAPDLQRVVDATRATDERRAQRPRLPTPVPEVPALTAEPTAPWVVWTARVGDMNIRVGPGNRSSVNPTDNTLTDFNRLHVLAHALAEAKRETNQRVRDEAAKLGQALDTVREALRPHGCTFPGGGLLGIANGVDEVVRKSAESMRERAAAVVTSHVAHIAPEEPLNRMGRRILRDLAALPLASETSEVTS